MDQSLRDDPPSGAPEAPAARIRALGASAVHRICSGQVITGLSVAVKELVENALDAGATSVVATFKEFGAEQFEVSDNGCGMNPEFLNRSLFRPFQTTKKNGLGIGMFQSKMIVEAHKGRIEVESEPCKGTTFRIYLPLQK